MTSSFRTANFEELADLHNGFVPDRYRIDAELLRQKTVDVPIFDWGASCIGDGDGFVAIKRSAAKLYRGPDADTACVTTLAFRDPKVMVDLMMEAKHALRDRGFARLQFGTDSAHFFPGCPTDFPTLRDFLIIEGFVEAGEAHDLERDLRTYESPHKAPEGDELRPVTEDDIPALEAFLDREFPGRWKYDTFTKIKAENDPSTVFGLFRGPKCEGFALVQRDGCKMPIGGAVWKGDLGENWGALGPIGVSAELRGRGSGGALLGGALGFLRDSGVARCIIDWTGLVDFYGKHGFEVTRTYRYMSLNLEQL